MTHGVHVCVPAQLVDVYGGLVAELKGTGLQANHLNQNAAFKSLIPQEKGVAVGMRGNALTQIGTPHYEFHAGLEEFWTLYRRGGLLEGLGMRRGSRNAKGVRSTHRQMCCSTLLALQARWNDERRDSTLSRGREMGG